MKLLKAQDYLLLIDEEAEIKEGNYRVHIYEKTLNHPVHRLEHGENTFDTWRLVLAYYPLTKEAKELDLPLLPVTPKDKWGVHETHCCEKCGCKYGDNDCCVAIGIAKAKYSCEYCDDDENDRQFTLEDMKDALNQLADEAEYGISNFAREEIITKIIQSLSTQQLPKEFILEYNLMNKGYDKPEDYPYQECKVLKTITNSSGKIELVGTYKY